VRESRKQNAIGFPPPLLGEQPLRLPVLAETDDWLALDKPGGIAVREYPWDTSSLNLDAALNVQLQAGKPELVKLGASLFGSVFYLDPVISGISVFAKSRDALSDLRNDFGSGNSTCVFTFVAGPCGEGVEKDFVADAPLLVHNVKPKMIPSSAKGKKARTDFRLLAETDNGWTLWEATAKFFRPHQVRAHAAVAGIPVLGDVVYDGPAIPMLRDLLSKKRGGSGLNISAFDRAAIHLSSCRLNPASDVLITSELPRQFQLLLKRLGLER